MNVRSRASCLLVVAALGGWLIAAASADPPAQPPAGQFHTPSGEADTHDPIDPKTGHLLDHYDKESRPQLIALLAHRNPAVRARAAGAFRYISDPPAEAAAPLIKLLVDPNIEVRQAAVSAIGSQKPFAEAAVAQLVAALKDPDATVVNEAAEALGKIGEKGAPGVAALIELMANDTHTVAAVNALGQIGPPARVAVPKLVPLLDHWLVGDNAAMALGRLGAAHPLLERVQEKSDIVRRNVVYGLGYVNPTDDRVVEALAAAGHDKSLQVVRQSAQSLGEAKPTNDKIVAALAELLKSPEAETRQAASSSLGKIDPKLDSAVPALMTALHDADADVRGNAAHALGDFKSNPKVRMLAMLLAATDDSDSARDPAVRAIKDNDKENLPLVLAMAKDSTADAGLRAGAVKLLGEMRWGHREEVKPVLALAFNESGASLEMRVYAAAVLIGDTSSDEDKEDKAEGKGVEHKQADTPEAVLLAGLQKSKKADVRRVAAEALGNAQSAAAIPSLVAALADPSKEVIRAAIHAVKEIKAEAAVAPLCAMAQDKKSDLRYSVIDALGEIGKGGAVSGPVLLALVKDSSNYGYSNAVSALAKVVKESQLDAGPIIRDLMPLLQDKEPSRRWTVVELLGQMPPKAAVVAVPALIDRLGDESSDVRRYAASALGNLGAVAAPAAPALVRALSDPKNEEVRSAVVEALGKIPGDATIVVPALTKSLSDAKLFRNAVPALAGYGAGAKPAIPALLPLLANSEEYIRRETIHTLASMGPAGIEAVPALSKLINDDPANGVKAAAAEALLAMGPENPEVLRALAGGLAADDGPLAGVIDDLGDKAAPLLAAGLKHSDAKVRKGALGRLGRMRDQQAAAPAYEVALADQDAKVRWTAAIALARVGGHTAIIAPVLVDALGSDEEETRDQAGMYLRQVGRQGLPALSKVIASDQSSKKARLAACGAAGTLSSYARATLPALKIAQASADPDLKLRATVTIAQIDSRQRDTAILLEAAKGADKDLRRDALRMLGGSYDDEGEQKQTDEKVIAVLIAALADPDREVSSSAAGSLSSCRLAEKHVAALTAALKNKASVSAAAAALGESAEPPAGMVPALIEVLGSSEEYVPEEAAHALSRICVPAIAPLLAVANDEKAPAAVRARAIAALGRMTNVPRENLKALAKIVMGPDATLKVWAAISMARLGVAHAKVLDALMEGLAAEDQKLQEAVNEAFSTLEVKGSGAVPALLARLKSENAEERLRAARVLCSVGIESDAAAAGMVSYFEAEPKKRNREQLNYLLSRFGAKLVPPLLALLESGKPEVKVEVVEVSGAMQKQGAPALPKLKQLAAGTDRLASAAVVAALRIDPKADVPVDALVRDLESKNDNQRAEALQGLAMAGARAAPAVNQLVTMLKSEEDADVAATILGNIGPAAAPAVPRLMELLKGKTDYDSVAHALAGIGEPARAAVPLLMEGLKSEQHGNSAAAALSKMGTAGEPAIAALAAMLRDDATAMDAAEWLDHFDARAASCVPALMALLDKDDPDLQSAGARTLGVIGAPAAAAAPKLMQLIESGPASVCGSAAAGLGHIKEPTMLPRLIVVFSTGDKQRSVAAADAIGEYGPAAAPAVPALIKALDDPQRRAAATGALGSLGATAAPAVGKLASLLAAPADQDRMRTLYALAEIGSASKSALPQLEPLLTAAHESEREAAISAIMKIAPERAEQLGLKRHRYRGDD